MKKFRNYIILISIIIFWSCSDYENQTIPNDYSTVDLLIEEGWNDYQNKDYTLAIEKFEDAASRNAQNTEAYIGKGWSQLRLTNYYQAEIEFNMVLNLAAEFDDNESLADGFAGLFIIKNAKRFDVETDPEQNPTEDDILEMMLEILEMGESALQHDSQYTTDHDPEFSSDELHIMLSQSYFYLHRFQESLEHVEFVYGDNVLVNNNFILEDQTETLNPWIDMNSNISTFTFDEFSSLSGIMLQNNNCVKIIDIIDENESFESVIDSLFLYLNEDTNIIFNSNNSTSSITDTLISFKVSHAQPGAPSQDFLLLETTKYGVYEVTSVSKVNILNEINWFRVDTSGVQADTSLADSVYFAGDLCCYFFSDTTQIEELIDVNSEVWSPLDPVTSLPVLNVNIIEPNDITGTYNYNYIHLPYEDAVSEEYIVTYKYGSYTINYQTTDNYIEYLDFLNSLLSEP
jgi:tetratricopeptide (TPR) repeat protein